jgi:uncharacterized protein (TIGR02145 family)
LNKLIPILFLAGVGMFLLTNCEERPRTNPFDPDAELDPNEWAPGNLEVQVISDSEIILTWTQEETQISGFRISRKEGSSDYSQIAELEANTTEYTDTGLILDTDYAYRVKAYTEVSESSSSNTAYIYLYYDCNNSLMGTAVEDCSGECNGTAVEDCNGDCNGTAFENECGNCVGGDTGIDETNCSVFDIDGNEYQTVIIGDQIWMAENLKVTHYRNGDVISHLTDNNSWGGTSNGAYCAYNNNEDNVDTYGRLYNWYAVDDSRNIAPEGWHIPSDNEWKQLEIYLGMDPDEADLAEEWRGTDEGGKLKDTNYWESPNTGATNESGFTALPAGYRGDEGASIFGAKGYFSLFWASTSSTNYHSWSRRLHYDHSDIRRPVHYNRDGYSIRCVKD